MQPVRQIPATPDPDTVTGYVSPYGKPAGLPERMAAWVDRMKTDRSLPFAGMGILEDCKLAARILNSREFLDWLRVNGTTEQADFAGEILRDLETLDAADDAARHVEGLPDEPHALDPVATIEKLDKRAVDYEAVRGVLIDCGALGEDDTETPVADLIRALLS